MRLPPVLAAVCTASLLVTACGDSGHGASGACGPIRREALDPKFLTHVLGDAQVEYTSDPPTSGPHQPTPPVSGVLAQPLPKPVQVGVLERGDILLQHRTDLPTDQRRSLEGLAGDGVVVAPAEELPSPVVATAWVFKRTCSSVDVPALRDFIQQRAGKGPGATR